MRLYRYEVLLGQARIGQLEGGRRAAVLSNQADGRKLACFGVDMFAGLGTIRRARGCGKQHQGTQRKPHVMQQLGLGWNIAEWLDEERKPDMR